MSQLRLDQLIPDPGVHGRTRVRVSAVRRYAQVAEPLPPVSVFRDPNGRYWLADGFLRYYALHSQGERTIEAEIREGGRRDAILFACGANAQHGQPRTREDRRLSTAALMLAPDFAGESDAEIAGLCGVSRALVAELRPHCTSPDQFAAHRAQELRRREQVREVRQERHRQQLAEHARTVAQPSPASAKTEPAKAEPTKTEPADPPTEPQPERPLTPREQAQAALARAAAAVKRAKQAMITAAQIYPEARCDSSFDAVNESLCHLEDQGVKCTGGTTDGGSSKSCKSGAKSSDPCADLESLARYFSNPAHCDAFLRPGASGAAYQPETLHPSPRGIGRDPMASNRPARPRPPPDD